jgi:hypothetical protein
MITLQDTIEIRTTAEDIFDFFIHFKENFKAWHPDHVRCWYLEEGPLREGSVFYVEEYVGSELLTLRFRVTRLVEHSRIEYGISRVVSGAFTMEPRDSSVAFTAEIFFGMKTPLLGGLLDKIVLTSMRSRLQALQQHMVEEGENLKRILEEGTQWQGTLAESESCRVSGERVGRCGEHSPAGNL